MSTSSDLSGFELVVHVGMGKAGSSSIQRTLRGAQQTLHRHAAHYVGLMFENSPVKLYRWQQAGGWPNLLEEAEGKAEAQLREVLVRSVDSARASGYNRLIWSNESLFGNHAFALPILEELNSQGAKITVVVYVRNHAAWARSAYLQWGVKHKDYDGPVKPFSQWYTARSISFYSGVLPWVNARWCNTVVRNFDQRPDVTTDFLRLCEFPLGEFELIRENDTPTPLAHALWAEFNSQSEGPVLPVELQAMLDDGNLLHRKLVRCDWNVLPPSSAELQQVLRDTERDRSKLNEILVSAGEQPLKGEAENAAEMTVTQDEINAALLLLIKRQFDRITELEKQLGRRP